jgi:hypothetical protein
MKVFILKKEFFMKSIAKVLLLAITVYAAGAWSSTSQTVDDVCSENLKDCRTLFDNYFTELIDENNRPFKGMIIKLKIRDLKTLLHDKSKLLEERKQQASILAKTWDYVRSLFRHIYYTMLEYFWPHGNSYDSIEFAFNNADPEITGLENQVAELRRKVAIAELVLLSLPAIENNKTIRKYGSSWAFINAEINSNQELEAFALLFKWLDVDVARIKFSNNLASNFAENSLHKMQLAIKESYFLTELYLYVYSSSLPSQKFSAALFDANFASDLAAKSRESSSKRAKLKKLQIYRVSRPEAFLSNMMPYYDVNNSSSAKFDMFNLTSDTPLSKGAVSALKRMLEGGLKDLSLDVKFDSHSSENLEDFFNFYGRSFDLGSLTLSGMKNGDIAKIISSLVDNDNNLKRLFLSNLKQDEKGDELMDQLARAYNQVDSKFKLNDLIIMSAPLLKAEEVFFQSFANSELASGIDTLDMSHQGLKDMHIKHLANSMTNGKFCPKRLIFMDNTISDTGVSYLLEALHHCPRLQRLDLSFNDQITSDGVSAINKYFFNHSNSKLIVWIDYQQMLRPSANGHTNTVEMQNILNNSSHFNILRGP